MLGGRKEFILTKMIPALIVLALWLDGWFYPLILLPILYVVLVEKKQLGWIGLTTRNLGPSIWIGLVLFAFIFLTYLPIFFHYQSTLQQVDLFDLYPLFTDAIWYPLYEEIAYRGFSLGHFTSSGEPLFSRKTMPANLVQSVLFLSIHYKHVAAGHPLILIPVFLLGLLNGFLFLRTRNTVGCILSHSLLNLSAMALTHFLA